MKKLLSLLNSLPRINSLPIKISYCLLFKNLPIKDYYITSAFDNNKLSFYLQDKKEKDYVINIFELNKTLMFINIENQYAIVKKELFIDNIKNGYFNFPLFKNKSINVLVNNLYNSYLLLTKNNSECRSFLIDKAFTKNDFLIKNIFIRDGLIRKKISNEDFVSDVNKFFKQIIMYIYN